MADETILSLATDIVAAHVRHNSLPASDLPTLTQSVFGALAGLGQDAPIAEEPRKPAVSVRASVKSDAITCLDCGTRAKMLKRHLATEHGLTPEDYRARWNLARDYPMVAPAYSARRKELALSIGLARKPKTVVASVPEAPAKAAPKRKVAAKSSEAVVAEMPATKPKAPRKRLKVAFDAVHVPQAEVSAADADTQG